MQPRRRKLLAGLGLDADNQPDQMDQESWVRIPLSRTKLSPTMGSGWLWNEMKPVWMEWDETGWAGMEWNGVVMLDRDVGL